MSNSPGDTRLSRRIAFRLSPSLLGRARAAADETGVSMSVWVRLAIENELKELERLKLENELKELETERKRWWPWK